MKCQHCGQREATVHLVEMDASRRRDLWLCSECAEAEQWRRMDSVSDRDQDEDVPGEQGGEIPGAFDAMLAFLGQAGRPEPRDGETACGHCGTTWVDFQSSGRLGCARCYQAFRRPLLPLLAAFHRHATYMGRAPRARAGGDTGVIEISRLRVALEKAIATEDFEEAARLRDQLHALEERGRTGPDTGENHDRA